ncbi:DUF4089 domain-containing protein [Labrys wisconsinensis]|uniref:DUF4089 domain-containing protein n=1 Tax=Labrys wisconsinensis TaxID=425677 RepID=A0ABU0J0D8_9HYPH|nr:DUF4089 domain-containing protein [Labrys wisconsinensis]MDQ0467726.1 hypothetical protein [Labrys wisconsinensis]
MSRDEDLFAQFDPEAVIDAMGPLLGLTITDEYRRGVILNLALTAQFAALVMAFPLGDHAEPAAVFTA